MSPFSPCDAPGISLYPHPDWEPCINIKYTRFPSGKFVGEWRKGTLSLSNAMTIYYCKYKNNMQRKNNDSAFYRHFSWVYSIAAVLFALFGYSIDVPMTAICYYIVFEKTPTLKTQYLLLGNFVGYVWIIPRRGSRFELQLLRDRQEAKRVVAGVR